MKKKFDFQFRFWISIFIFKRFWLINFIFISNLKKINQKQKKSKANLKENLLTPATKLCYNIIKEKEREGKTRWAREKETNQIQKKVLDKINKNMV